MSSLSSHAMCCCVTRATSTSRSLLYSLCTHRISASYNGHRVLDFLSSTIFFSFCFFVPLPLHSSVVRAVSLFFLLNWTPQNVRSLSEAAAFWGCVFFLPFSPFDFFFFFFILHFPFPSTGFKGWHQRRKVIIFLFAFGIWCCHTPKSDDKRWNNDDI